MEISELKQDLAAVFRWTAKLSMNEGVANHFSVCLPNSNDFYVNGSGLHFSSIKASDMVLVKQNKIEEIKKKPELVDPTALNIHATIHKKVPHARCILHVHSKYATTLSTLKNPKLEPIDQNTMRFYNRVAIHDDYGGLGFEEESNKMAGAIGNSRLMLLANHGILTVGQ
ncbi:class II aldolase/adducin family protein, partial [Candidatus Pelagibacter sp.]|nr:class II aldolase/adducin family protein [Candidatus Pelagibacter sp.]